MMNRKLLMVPLLVLLYLSPMFVHGELTYDVMPKSGLSTQSILISVRDSPITGDYKQYIYIFWDGIILADRQLCVDLKNDNYMYMWDKTITPPKAANSYGKHLITIWIETEYGLRKTLYYQYTVTDGLPTTVEAWELFLIEHPEILAKITGPKGDTGSPGVPGAAGARGAKGEKGDTGAVAEIDYEVLWRSVPLDIYESMRGPQGEQGPQGDQPNPIYFALVFILSVAVSLWIYMDYEQEGWFAVE